MEHGDMEVGQRTRGIEVSAPRIDVVTAPPPTHAHGLPKFDEYLGQKLTIVSFVLAAGAR